MVFLAYLMPCALVSYHPCTSIFCVGSHLCLGAPSPQQMSWVLAGVPGLCKNTGCFSVRRFSDRSHPRLNDNIHKRTICTVYLQSFSLFPYLHGGT